LILAKVFGWGNKGPGIKITLGDFGNEWKYNEIIEIVERLGNEHVKCDIDEFVNDKDNKIFSTPTYLNFFNINFFYSIINKYSLFIIIIIKIFEK